MDRGDERVVQGDLAAALILYRSAHAIMNVPTTGIEVAKTYSRLGKLLEARSTALEVIRMPAREHEPKPFAGARAEATMLDRELAQEIPTLLVEIAPPEAAARAAIRIDGKAVSSAALRAALPLNPEEHRLEAVAAGFNPVDMRLVLSRGERRTLNVVFRPLTPSGPSPARGIAPPTGPPAGHTPTSRAEDGIAARMPWTTWAGLGVFGAGILTGSIAGVVSIQHANAAKEYCTGNLCTPEARVDRDAAIRAANISNVGWALAGAGLGVSAVTFWLSRPTGAPQAAATSSLTLGPLLDGGMLEWKGSLW